MATSFVVSRHKNEAVAGIGIANGQITISIQGDGVVFHDGSTRKRTGSRPLGRSTLHFLCPAVYDASSGHHVAALTDRSQSARFAVAWQQDAASSSAAASVTSIADVTPKIPLRADARYLFPLSRNVAGAATGEAAKPAVAAVFADGTVALVNWASLSAVECARAAGADKAAAVAAAAAHGRYVATVAQARPGGAAAVEVYVLAPKERKMIVSQSFELGAPGGEAAPIALALSNATVTVLWSDGCLTVSAVNLVAFTGAAPDPPLVLRLGELFLGPAAAAAVGAPTETPGKKRKAAAAAAGAPAAAAAAAGVLCVPLSNERLVLLKAAPSVDGDGFSAHHAVVHCRYGCVLAAGRLALGATAPEVRGRQALVAVDETVGAFALQLGGAVLALQLDVPPGDLLSQLGRLALGGTAAGGGAASSSGAKDDCALALAAPAAQGATEPAAALNVPVGYVDLPRIVAAATRQGGAGTLASVPADAGGDAASFGAAALPPEAAPLLAALQAGKKLSGEQLQRLTAALAAPAAAGAALRPQLVGAMAMQLAEGGLWVGLEALLRSQPLPSLTHCPGLLPALAAAGRPEAVASLCVHCRDIPASAIVETLELALKGSGAAWAAAGSTYAARVRAAAEAALSQAEAAIGIDPAALDVARCAAAAVDGFSHRELLLHPLLFVVVDTVEAQAALRRLSAASVRRLLRYLAKWVAKYTRELGDGAHAVALPAELVFPTLGQALEWLKATLDAHFTRLAMQPDAACSQLLESLAADVKEYAAGSSGILMLRGVAEHMQRGAPLPAAHIAAAAAYTVELLDLRVKP